MGKKHLVDVDVFQAFCILAFFACSGTTQNVSDEQLTSALITPAQCSQINRIEVHYKNYFDVYLGNAQFTTFLKAEGLFVKMLNKAVNICCHSLDASYTFAHDFDKEVEEQVLLAMKTEQADRDAGVYKFYFPEFADKQDRTVYDIQAEFVRLSQSPGHAIVMKKPDPIKPVFVGEIFVKSWAILIFLITFAWVIGILAWMTDHHKNPTQFPNPFYVGMFEGFWWSIVTMTTVGYGDKAPKSNIARLLAVVWIMISTVFLSLFTANATSILAISQAEEDHTITLGKTIGVLNSKHFVEVELNLGAQIKEYDAPYTLVKALESQEINRLLFPNYLDFLLLATDENYASLQGSLLTNVLDYPFQIGLVLARESSNLTDTDQALLTCMRSALPTLEKTERRFIDFSRIKFTEDTSKKELKTALDSDNLLSMTYYLFGIIFALFCVGIVFDAWRNHKEKQRRRQEADDMEIAQKPVSADSFHEIPSQHSTPTMEHWDDNAAVKYKTMSISENPPLIDENCSPES